MNTYFNMLSKDIKKLWGGLELPQKFVIILLIIVSVGAITYFISKSTEPNWGVLYSDLAEPDAVAVVENLKKAGYPYKVSDDKKTILVPIELKEDLRLMIAENDVIHDSNPGFELLDKLQLGATDFQNKLTRQRIFQGELTRTIEKIQGISKARVQIADPERTVFDNNEEKPSAAVMLILEPGIKLKQEQIKAIKNLVAYGIPRLTPDRVFVSDQSGNPLSEELNNSSTDVTDYRANFERETTKKIEKVIEKIVGKGNASVEVSVLMNFDSARSTIERYIPAKENPDSPEGIVSATQSESEIYGNGNPTTQTTATMTADQKKNYEKVRKATKYNVSKEVKQVIYAPGTVQRMTIAVALNNVLTAKEKEELKNLIISASGADLQRGDMVTITGMQFAEDENAAVKEKMMTEIEKTTNMEFWVRNVAPLAVVLILGLSALFVLSSLIKKPLQGEEVYDDDEHYARHEGEQDHELLEAAAIPIIEAKLDPELERMRGDLNNIILADPSEAARLLLSYVKE